MKNSFLYPLLLIFFVPVKIQAQKAVGTGLHPSVSVDPGGAVHLVLGQKNTILYSVSKDNGQTFSAPVAIDSLSGYHIGASRGPQIAATPRHVVITAIDRAGNVLAWSLDRPSGRWTKRIRVTDQPDIAKEGFVALAVDSALNFHAVWLDLRNDRRNKLAEARSTDGGRTWSANRILYRSAAGTICECCQPTVAARGRHVAVMFRNNLNGCRDMYLLASSDYGQTFGDTVRLGQGTWPLEACPMDGGGMALGPAGIPATIWRRREQLYTVHPGELEAEAGTGRNPKVAVSRRGETYAWQADGRVWAQMPGSNSPVPLGSGGFPKLATLADDRVLCVWEQDGSVVSQILN
ncbi:sialidase family protein [Larkinella soli]|uniref:sialidase family protein n=1 Tax=Larkinella soli TaxID=1770527 RepID=UPI000FFC7B7D|nr:sialidase family protein [Larkinella soli]